MLHIWLSDNLQACGEVVTVENNGVFFLLII